MKELNWNPRAYGIATRTKKFSQWGVGDEIVTHLGRRALTHGQPVENGRNVRATFLDATDEELAQGTDIPMAEIAKHHHWSQGYERHAYTSLMTRVQEARKQLEKERLVAQKQSEPKAKRRNTRKRVPDETT
jgi:hypothetical protein